MGGSFCEKVTDASTLRMLRSGARPRKRGLRDPFFKSGEENTQKIMGKLHIAFAKVNLGNPHAVPVSVSQPPPFP
jgi:hypothetical protein